MSLWWIGKAVKKINPELIILLVLQLGLTLFWSRSMRYNEYPDECVHFKMAQFFQREKRLPVAYKDEITFVWDEKEKCIGAGYVTMPFISHMFAAKTIEWGKGLGIEREYLGARMASVVFGLIFVFFLYLFFKEFFGKKSYLIAPTVISVIMIPQLTYTFSAVNVEAYSLATSAFLIFTSWHLYVKLKKNSDQLIDYLLLSFAVAGHFFSKYNFYLLFTVPILVLVKSFFKYSHKRRVVVGGILLVIIVSSLLCGWFFRRNLTLYNDFFGLKTFHQIFRGRMGGGTCTKMGWSYTDVIFKTNWLSESLDSFYGRFGYMNVLIDPGLQWFFRLFVFFGLVGFIKKISKTKKKNLLEMENLLLLLYIILFPVSIFLSLKNTIDYDFQAQGRYLFPALIPLMVVVNLGIFEISGGKKQSQVFAIAIIFGSILANFFSFLYLPKI